MKLRISTVEQDFYIEEPKHTDSDFPARIYNAVADGGLWIDDGTVMSHRKIGCIFIPIQAITSFRIVE